MYQAFEDELEKIASSRMEKELAPYIEGTEQDAHMRPSAQKGAYRGAAIGALAGVGIPTAMILASKDSKLGKAYNIAISALPGAMIGGAGGVLAGRGIGDYVGKRRGEIEKLYSVKERRMGAISKLLHSYSSDFITGDDPFESWNSPTHLKGKELTRHKGMLRLEKEYVKAKGHSPF